MLFYAFTNEISPYFKKKKIGSTRMLYYDKYGLIVLCESSNAVCVGGGGLLCLLCVREMKYMVQNTLKLVLSLNQLYVYIDMTALHQVIIFTDAFPEICYIWYVQLKYFQKIVNSGTYTFHVKGFPCWFFRFFSIFFCISK